MKKITIVCVILGLALASMANFAVAQESGKDATTPVVDQGTTPPPEQGKNLSKKEAKKAAKEAKKAQEKAVKAQKEAQKEAEENAKKSREQAEKENKKAREQAEKAKKDTLKEEKEALEKSEKEARKAEKAQPKLSRQERQFQNKESRLDDNVAEINRLAKVEGVKEDVFQSIWREHSVSAKRLNKQLETFPGLGAGDLLVADLIARTTHKPVDEVVAAKTSGSSWAEVAKQNNVSVAELIEYLSAFMTLQPGDVILTGTPEGVVNVNVGDEVVCEIDGIGHLHNTIVAERSSAR